MQEIQEIKVNLEMVEMLEIQVMLV